MGMTVEFYSGDPQEIQTLFFKRNEGGDIDEFFEKLESYPKADFSFRLHVPEDLDSLCQILQKHNGGVPPVFSELLMDPLWNDGISESLTVLASNFARALADMSTSVIEQAALDWAKTFPYQEPLRQTPAYKSLLQLREVALDAVTYNRSLLFYLEGNPAFFRWP
jgi:hypothetical protein